MELKPGITSLTHVDEDTLKKLIGNDNHTNLLKSIPVLIAINTNNSINLAFNIGLLFKQLRQITDQTSEYIHGESSSLLLKINDYIERWSNGNHKKAHYIGVFKDLDKVLTTYEELIPQLFKAKKHKILFDKTGDVRRLYGEITTSLEVDSSKGKHLFKLLKELVDRYVDAWRSHQYIDRYIKFGTENDLKHISDPDTFLLDTLYLQCDFQRKRFQHDPLKSGNYISTITHNPFYVFGIPFSHHRKSELGKGYTQEIHTQFLVNVAIAKLEDLSINWFDIQRTNPYGIARITALEAGCQSLNRLSAMGDDNKEEIEGWMRSLRAPGQGPSFYIKYVFLLIDEAARIKHKFNQWKEEQTCK